MSDNIIFIHVLKTGGTTINSAMQGTYWQTAVDFNYRHLVFKEKRSNSGDIFLPINQEKYKRHNIIMMLRHPVDRLISEYYFLFERAEFMNLLSQKPKSFEEYVLHPQTINNVISFLIGDKMYSKNRPTKNDLARVIETVDNLPIYTGIFEYFSESLNYFSQQTDITWKSNIEAKRVTFKRPKFESISEELYQKIIKLHSLDMELYNHCLAKFKTIQKTLPTSKISFEIDKYNHVIAYANLTILFEYFMENKHFIRQNFQFFKDLTFHLLKYRGIKDGKKFTQIWNQVFIDSVKTHFPDSEFYNVLNSTYKLENDSLDTTGEIAKALDDFFANNPKGTKKFYQPMTFNPLIIVEPKIEKKKGFLGKIFGK